MKTSLFVILTCMSFSLFANDEIKSMVRNDMVIQHVVRGMKTKHQLQCPLIKVQDVVLYTKQVNHQYSESRFKVQVECQSLATDEEGERMYYQINFDGIVGDGYIFVDTIKFDMAG